MLTVGGLLPMAGVTVNFASAAGMGPSAFGMMAPLKQPQQLHQMDSLNLSF